MSAPPTSRGEILTSKRQLIDWIASGEKPKDAWRIGTEHEKFLFELGTNKPLPYEDQKASVRGLLDGLTRFGWQPVLENGKPIALLKDNCSVTLEPGGQFELSGAPLETLYQTCDETNRHLAECKTVAAELGLGLLGMGFAPEWTRADIHWMPKGRYKIMRDYMPKVGTMGLDMMLRTCTVQTNLDFSSEADMVQKFRVSLALQPIATAIFADSPFLEGKPSGYLSYRSHTWTDTDANRCGLIPFVFEDGMGYERYVDWMLDDVPMYFVYRNQKYVDAAGRSFKTFMAEGLPDLTDEPATTGDWSDHITTAFPEVRLKKYLEMRGADGGPWKRLCALPALFVGLLYDQAALDEASALVKGWTIEEMLALRRDVTKHALKAKFRNGTVNDIAAEMVAIARRGLRARQRFNRMGDADESVFLDTLQETVESGDCPAEEKLRRYETEWGRSVTPLYDIYAY
jgi:glutamate--cysteine ligase